MNERVINWTWATAKDRYTGFWPIGEGIPADLLADGDLAFKTRDAFIRGKEIFFEPLKLAQPMTWKMLTEFCSPPLLVRSAQHPTLISILSIANELVVTIKPFTVADDLRNWSEILSALPEPLHAYYQNFNGMRASYSNLGAPYNLPKSVGYWRRLSDYSKEESVNKKYLKRIQTEIGNLEHIEIFIETEWKDLAMVNVAAQDKRIFAVPRGKFEETFELQDSTEVIDRLCAHVLSGSLEPCYLKQ